MKVETRGTGEIEFTIIGSIHGDEPAGKKAIKNVLEKDLKYNKAVKFIIANEEALEEDERFLDTDLNRSFPGDIDSDQREERLAAKLLSEIGASKVLDIHTTHSFDRPFANTKSFEDPEMEMIQASGADYAVKFEEDSGTLTDFATGVVVEAGTQHSDQAVENAVNVIENFLAYFGVIDAEFEASDPELFVQKEKVEGDWRFLKENFQKVEKGEVYARRDNEELIAEEDFYPVLMSTNGYDGVLGHKASKFNE
ncbi:MAG: succinylglutamate desuccinylase/aspartoacylase family protein [Candidatus Nanohaloarchaea archaeon]